MASADHPAPTKRKLDPSVLLALAAVMITALLLGIPALINALDSRWIAEDFGTEDAVVALRITEGDKSYLALVDEDGSSRVARVDERGFENSRLAWTTAGLSTGGPDTEYVLQRDGLTKLDLPETSSSSVTEGQRLAAPGGFLVVNGSAEGYHLAFIDAERGRVDEIDIGQSHAELAACEDEVVMVASGGELTTVTPKARELRGQNVFDDLAALRCEGERVYGFGEIQREGRRPTQSLRIWDRGTGAMGTAEIVYPRDVSAFDAHTPFTHDGRLYWTADSDVWSVPLEGDLEGDLPSGAPKVISSADLGPSVEDFFVSSDEWAAYAPAGRCVIGVGFRDRPGALGIFATDVESRDRRIVLEVDDIDPPRYGPQVTALALRPGWTPKGC